MEDTLIRLLGLGLQIGQCRHDLRQNLLGDFNGYAGLFVVTKVLQQLNAVLSIRDFVDQVDIWERDGYTGGRGHKG